MRAGVQEASNQVREEHEIAPIISQDTSSNINNGDKQQLEAMQAVYGPILAFMKLYVFLKIGTSVSHW